MPSQSSISKAFIIENEGSRQRNYTGKELVMQKELVTLSSSAASDVPSMFAAGEKVWVVPCYPETVAADGKLDIDVSAATDGATMVMIFGSPASLKNSTDV